MRGDCPRILRKALRMTSPCLACLDLLELLEWIRTVIRLRRARQLGPCHWRQTELPAPKLKLLARVDRSFHQSGVGRFNQQHFGKLGCQGVPSAAFGK